MKTKLLLVSVMLGLGLTSTAQITVNRSDLGNLIGVPVISANDSTNLNLLSPGSAGANQTWNLAGIGNNYKDTIQFVSPTGTPCSNSFPTATLAGSQHGMFFYMHDNSTVLEMIGICGVFMPPNTTVAPFTPPQKQMTFPSTYNTSFSGQSKYIMKFAYSSPPIDSLKTISSSSYTSSIDGWGNVTTPGGTYPSLRQKMTTYSIDSTFIHSPGGWVFSGPAKRDTTIEYSWWSQHNPFIADIKTNAQGVVKGASYLLSSTMGINDIQDISIMHSVFPNPSNGDFTLQMNIEQLPIENYQLSIYNMIGEKVFQCEIKNPKSEIHLDLPKGMYFYQLKNKQKKIGTGKISIQ